jgi:Tol biopolymer transport system component
MQTIALGAASAADVPGPRQQCADRQNSIADGGSFTPSMSADGRWVAFASKATNLVADGGAGAGQGVFVVDTSTGRIARVDVGPGGQPADADSADPSISSDGRFVVFDSFATNLIHASARRTGEVYERDLLTGTTVRVSAAADGSAADQQSGVGLGQRRRPLRRVPVHG